MEIPIFENYDHSKFLGSIRICEAESQRVEALLSTEAAVIGLAFTKGSDGTLHVTHAALVTAYSTISERDVEIELEKSRLTK